MSRKSRRRRKQSTGVLSWFRSQQNITKLVYLFVAFIFVGGVFVGFGGAMGGGGGGCNAGSARQLTAEQIEFYAQAVAVVGEKDITREEFELEWLENSAADRPAEEMGIYVPPPEDYYIHRYAVLDRLMMQNLIELESAKRGIVVQGSEIDAEVAKFKLENLSLGITKSGKRSLFQRIGDLLSGAKEDKNYRARLWEKIKMTPEGLEKYFQMQLLSQKFSIDLEDEIRTSLESDAQAEIDLVIEKLNEGEDFASLVEEYSDDYATKDLGGLVEDIKRNSSQPQEIISLAFDLAVGEISSPFKVTDEMENPYQPGQKLVFESQAIIEITDKRVTTGDEFEGEIEEIRELIRQEKFEAEIQDNPEIALEDIDVSDEEIAAEYEKVSYRIIKVDSVNMALTRERSMEVVEVLRESYDLQILDTSLLAWEKARTDDFKGAREEWAFYMEDPLYAEDSPKILSIEDDQEREDAIQELRDRKAQLDYIYGLFYKIQIDGYQSMMYGFSVGGEKQKRYSERWDAYNEDPEAWGDEQPNLEEPTEEEAAHYRQLNEEALPYFERAAAAMDIDPYALVLLGETQIGLERYEEAFPAFNIAAEYASDDMALNSRIRTSVGDIVVQIGEAEAAEEILDLMNRIDEKINALQAEMQAAEQATGGGGGMSFGG